MYINHTLINISLGLNNYTEQTLVYKSEYNLINISTTVTFVVYKCSPYCINCTYDPATRVTGSNCSQCDVGFSLSGLICKVNCGDSMRYGNEICDDGNDDGEGCATGCLAISPLYNCNNTG